MKRPLFFMIQAMNWLALLIYTCFLRQLAAGALAASHTNWMTSLRLLVDLVINLHVPL